MSNIQVQLRRGTTAQHSSFTGAQGELTVDTDKNALVLHDGTNQGGVQLARETALNVLDYIPESLHASIVNDTNSTNLAPYINTAIDSLATTGGTIFFPTGYYFVRSVGADDTTDDPNNGTHSAIRIKYDNIKLMGAGNSSVIKCDERFTNIIVACKDDAVSNNPSAWITGVHIHDLQIIGNDGLYPAGQFRGDGIHLAKANRGSVRRCYIKQVSMRGIVLQGGGYLMDFSHNLTEECGYTGINTNLSGGWGNTISSNLVYNTGTDTNHSGIQASGGTNVNDNHVLYSTGPGISVGEVVFSTTVSGNTVIENGLGGIKVQDSNVENTATAIVGNILISNYTANGVSVETPGVTTVSGNVFIDNYPFDLNVSGGPCTVTGNTFDYVSDFSTASTAHYYNLDGLNLSPTVRRPSANIIVSGTGAGSIISDNIINGGTTGIQFNTYDLTLTDNNVNADTRNYYDNTAAVASVDNPFKSKSRAARTVTTQVVATTTQTKVQLDTETYDTLDEMDVTTNHRFTARNSGYYDVSAVIRYETATVDQRFDAQLWKNGSPYGTSSIHASNTAALSVPISDLIYLNSGDYLELYAYHTAGVNRLINPGSSATFLSVSAVSY